MKFDDLDSFEISMYDVKDQLKQFIYGRSLEAFAKGDQARNTVETIEQLTNRRTWVRESFLRSIGGLPPSDTPLNPQITGVLQCRGYKIEKIMFESRPRQWVTANLYIPDGIKQPSGTVLHLCGHNPMAKHADIYQRVSQHLVRAGLIVFNIDPIGQGERLSYYEQETGKLHIPASTREHEHVGRQCLPLGDNLARYFIHDAMRAIDYLCTRPEVDQSKIGVTGCSGGGTQTSMMMICDSRIAAAAPAAFIMNRQSYMYAGQAQDAEQIWTGMTKLGFDHEDLIMAMAPRPVLVLAAQYDYFPIEGTRRTVERVKRFWEMYEAASDLELFEDACPHGYSDPMAKAAAKFFSKHLLNKELDCTWDQIEPLKPELLWCTKSGQVRGDIKEVRGVYEENLDRLLRIERKLETVSETSRKEQATAWLREKVLADRKSYPLNLRRQVLDGLDDDLSAESILWWSQEGLFNHGFLFYKAASNMEENPVTIGLWPRGTRETKSHMDWIRETCEQGRNVLVLDVSGDGAITPNALLPSRGIHDFYGTMHKLTIDLFWLDDSLAALRCFDVIRSLDLIDHLNLGANTDRDVQLFVEGRYSLYGEIVGVLDERLKSLEIKNGVGEISEFVRSRYYEWLDSEGIIIPGMLQLFDLPDLQRWNDGIYT